MRFSKLQQAHLDFTSALYLGFHHDYQSLLPWSKLTTGVPAALSEPILTSHLSRQLAKMIGLEEACAFPSTLHLFRDLFDYLNKENFLYFLDDQAYPISRWGMEGILKAGENALNFPHGNVHRLNLLLKSNLRRGQRPVIITDGWCPQCGCALPLQGYLSLLKSAGGLLVIDDTQALGLLGKNPTPQMPYGFGGGGILPWFGMQSPNIIVGSSLAKGFGVPLAILAGNRKVVERIRQSSKTRVHCSPPSNADFRATQHALRINEQRGDELRRLLYTNVVLFKQRLQKAGIFTSGGIFPVQMIKGIERNQAIHLLEFLSEKDVQALLTKTHTRQVALSFMLRADHDTNEILKVTSLIAKKLATTRKKI